MGCRQHRGFPRAANDLAGRQRDCRCNHRQYQGPDLHPEGAYQAEIGSYKTRRASVAVSGPLVEDQLAARVALDYSGRDTFIDYINKGFYHKGTDQNFREFNGRVKLLWEPPEIPGLTAKLTYSFNASNRPSQEAASKPFDELQHVTNTMPSWKQRTNTAIFDLSYELDNGVKLYNQTQFSASIADRTTGLVNNGDANIDQKNVSEEIRATFGDKDDTLSGVVGIYYANNHADGFSTSAARRNSTIASRIWEYIASWHTG